jgi:hypothetical protein
MYISPVSCYLLHVRPKLLPQCPILEHPHPTFFPQCGTKFHTRTKQQAELLCSIFRSSYAFLDRRRKYSATKGSLCVESCYLRALWNMQHRHRHQSIFSSISRVIRRVTSHRAGSPTSQNRHLFNLCPSNTHKNRYKVCVLLDRVITSKLFKRPVRISQCSVSDSSQKYYVIQCSLDEVFWHVERCASWLCSHPGATGCHYTDNTATIFQTSQETVTTRHLAGTVTTTPHNLFG